MVPRALAVAASLAVLAGACGAGDDGSAATTAPPVASVPSSIATTAPPATVPPDTTAPPATAPPATAPTTTVAPETTTSTSVAPAAPVALPDVATVIDDVDLGAGFVLGTSPVAPVAWVLAPGDGPEAPGCEGLPAEALWAQPLDGSARTPALPDVPDRVGITTVPAHPDGRVLLVRACEGLFVDAHVGTADGDGAIRDVEPVDLPDSTLFSTIRLTPGGVTYVDRDQFDGTDGTLVELDVETGTTNVLLSGDVWDGVGLASGSLLHRTSTELFVDGFSLGTFPEAGPFAFDLELSDDGLDVATTTATGIAAYLGADDELGSLLDEEVAVLDWHPSGEAVLVNGPVTDEGTTPPRVVLLDGTTIPVEVGADAVGAAFSADGTSVVITNFVGGETIELLARALVFG